jgi:hypothetical protein
MWTKISPSATHSVNTQWISGVRKRKFLHQLSEHQLPKESAFCVLNKFLTNKKRPNYNCVTLQFTAPDGV